MTRLLDALVELGVPDPSSLDELVAFGNDLYQRVDPSDLDDQDAVAEAARGAAPEFVALAEAASRAEDPRSEKLLSEVASALPELRRLVFLDAADVALNCPHLITGHARPMAAALANRVESTRTDDGLQAYAYLEVLTRLGLTQSAARLRAVDLLLSVTSNDSPDFLERLPRLIGLALDRWREDELVAVLDRLTELEETRVDALFEIAQLSLRSALEKKSLEEAVVGLVAARDQFVAVDAMAEAREDATIYRCALDVLIAFVGAGAGASKDVTETAETLSAAAARRAAFSPRSVMGDWAAPRRQAEVEWYVLARTLKNVAPALGQVSWLTPVETLSQVLAVYRASRSVTVVSAEGLRIVLEPTVEAAFIRREGLLAHLKDALEAEAVPADEIEAARALLESVSSFDASAGGDAVGKVWAAAPALAAELGLASDPAVAADFARAVDYIPSAINWMNQEAEARARARARSCDPVVDQLLNTVLADLEDCKDLTGTARAEFVEVLTEVLRFTVDRADVGRGGGGPEVAYLFPPKDGKAFTEDFLQRDMNSWFKSSMLRRFTRMEEPDVAAGRADLTVTQDHRFTVEVKRELRNASRDAIVASYGGQSAAYTVVGPRLSLAMVLDLTDHTYGVPSVKESVWVDEVPIDGGEPRHVVTIVVRGNRPTPRYTKTR